jgi:hypothetical protein
MLIFGKKRVIEQISVWIQESLLFLICFFYLLFQVHPVLTLEAQSPVFLKGINFLNEFLRIPGGLTNWLSAFFLQCWFSDFFGALFLTFCFWIIAFLTKKWMETLTKGRPIHTFHLVPAGLLLVLHSNYDFRLSITLALFINLFFLVLFLRWAQKNQTVRLIIGLSISLLLYWITGGAFFTFTILCGLNEIFFRKQIINGSILLIVSAILPFAASKLIFLATLKQAYLHNMVFENPVKFEIIGYALHIYFLMVILAVLLIKLSIIQKMVHKLSGRLYVWKWAVGTIILLTVTVLLARESDNETNRIVLQINRFAGENRWTEVLESARRCSNINSLVLSQTNLALFQTGKLLDSMFTYPQARGSAGLLMDQTWCVAWPEEMSNLTWKLGLINESLHWAHEAVEYKGPTPNLLKRLGLIYMIKGENEAARHFFLNLKNIPFQNNIADSLIRLNENPAELAQDSTCGYMKSCMLKEDLISGNEIGSREFVRLLERNPQNRMAFEYIIAFYLLNANVKRVSDCVPFFRIVNYAKIPRHVQEALMVYASTIPKFDLNKLKGFVEPMIFNRFREYYDIIAKHKYNLISARLDLQTRFGDSYWYFLMYSKMAAAESEKLREYQ